jgi:LPXTG-site transpeptidase (sortase) family protein
VICDVTGWFTGSPAAPYRAVPVDPPPPPAQLPYIVSVPRMGLGKWVYDGDSAAVVDSGQVWHWSGTGLVGQGTSTVMFGHRTSAGGPFRSLNTVQGGDELYVLTPDGRRYTYQSRAGYITSKYPSDILATARNLPGDTVSLVACSKPNGQPTSLSYRLVVTFVLVNWVDLG